MKTVWEILIILYTARYSYQDTNEVIRPIDADNSKLQLIFPGTKWCGQGNIATDDNDFGIFNLTDMCCKNHDYCPKHIVSGATQFNLTNNGLFTKVHCDCEGDFHHCLKDVNSVISQKIGSTYFNVVGSECFKYEYPIIRCSTYSPILKSRCLEYELDTSKLKEWQFFDNPLY